MFRFNEIVQQKLDSSDSHGEVSFIRYKPMLVPPRPWLSVDRGGFLSQKTVFMRTHGSRLQVQIMMNTICRLSVSIKLIYTRFSVLSIFWVRSDGWSTRMYWKWRRQCGSEEVMSWIFHHGLIFLFLSEYESITRELWIDGLWQWETVQTCFRKNQAEELWSTLTSMWFRI